MIIQQVTPYMVREKIPEETATKILTKKPLITDEMIQAGKDNTSVPGRNNNDHLQKIYDIKKVGRGNEPKVRKVK